MSAPPQPPQLPNIPNLPTGQTPTQLKLLQFKEGASGPRPYNEIQKRATAAITTQIDNSDTTLTPAQKLLLGQMTTWQKNFPTDIVDLPHHAQQTMKGLRTDFAKKFYFWTAYSAVRNHLNVSAVGNNFEDKQSGLVQSNGSCPGNRAAYVQCSDVYHSIDITTRLSLPVHHQVTCRQQFVALEQCMEHHMRNWSRTMRAVTKFHSMPEFEEYYTPIAAKIEETNAAAAVATEGAPKPIELEKSLFNYQPDLDQVNNDRPSQVKETMNEVSILFPQEFFGSEYEAEFKAPLPQELVQENTNIARSLALDVNQLTLDAVIYNIQKSKAAPVTADQ